MHTEPCLRVRERANGRSVTWPGVMMCNSIHACAVCSSKIRAERRAELEVAFASVDDEHAPRMFTLTFRHHTGLDLAELLAGMKLAWRFTRSTRRVRDIYDRHVVGTVRAIEVTHGAHGWHPHIHVVALTSEWDDSEMTTLREVWAKSVERAFKKLAKERFARTPSRARARYEEKTANAYASAFRPASNVGVKWSAARERRASAAHYISKLGLEVTHVASKASSSGSRSPWDIQRDAIDGDVRSIALAREYEKAMKGTRLIEQDERMKGLAGALDLVRKQKEGEVGKGADVTVSLSVEFLFAMRRAERVDPLAVRRIEEAAKEGELTEQAVSDRIDARLAAMLLVLHERHGPGLHRSRGGDEDARRDAG